MQEPEQVRPGRVASPAVPESDYDRLFNLSLDLLCVAGLDGYFKRVNPSWTRILGWSEAELLSRPVADFMHPDDRERTLKARADLARGVPVVGLENRYLCKDGSYRWLSWQSAVEPAAATVFAVARDITERRQLEHEHLVRSKLESTGILAGGIAHDFNNLLASLLLNLEYVSFCGPTTLQQEGNLEQARQTILAARALTNQLITFADGGAPARRLTDLREVLRQSMDLALKGSAIRGECVLPENLWSADVDEGQIGQVLRNLILNAREASSTGGSVRLEAENVTYESVPAAGCARGDYLRISVSDHGSGIPAELMPKIFDPYFSTKQRGTQKGMGLGLTICRMVIRKHGGTIEVSPRREGGTVVVCHLPAVRESSTRTPVLAPAAASHPPRVLVMDDEELFLEIMESTLHGLGYDVTLAPNGDKALVLYQKAKQDGRPFDVVMLDLTIRGGMGGSETIKLLRERDPGVRAVLMTGYSNEPTFRTYSEHGFKAALEKPFSAGTLRNTLVEILQVEPALRGTRVAG